MKRVLCLMNDGFEEIETVVPVDLLRRAGFDVTLASIAGPVLTGRCGMRMEADRLLTDESAASHDLLLIPGGPGVAGLRQDGRAAGLARAFADARKPVAAICAAPLVLMDAGLLEGKRFTAYQSVREELGGGEDERVVVDGDIITSRGAGTAMDFALVLVAILGGEPLAAAISTEIMA